MVSRLKMGDQEAVDHLCMAGHSRREAAFLVYRAMRYTRFLGSFDQARIEYKERRGFDDSRVRRFGDWGRMSGAEINKFFFERTSSKLNPRTLYEFLLLRDENGIPSRGMVYTSVGSLVGEVSLPVPGGNISLVAERWTDYVSWTSGLVLAQNTKLASFAAKSSVTPDGSFRKPVAVVFGSEGEAAFFSSRVPSISLVAGETEPVYQAAPLHGRSTPVLVYRFPGDASSGYGVSGAFEDEIGRITPKILTQDIIDSASASTPLSPSDLCDLVSKCPNSSDHFRNDLVERFGVATGSDKSSLGAIAANAGSGVGHFSIAKKIFKIHQGRYCEMPGDLSVVPVSNFWVSVNYATYSDDGDIEYNITLHAGNRSSSAFVDHRTFMSPRRLMDKLASMSVIGGMEHPIWTSKKYIFDVFPQIVRGLAPAKIRSVKKEVAGFYGGCLTASKWRCGTNGILVQDFEIGGADERLDHPDLSDLGAYRTLALSELSRICGSRRGAYAVAVALSLVEAGKAGSKMNFVVPQYSLDDIASVLGAQKTEKISSARTIQVSSRPMTPAETRKSMWSVSPDPGLRDLPEEPPASPSAPLLPFLCEAVFCRERGADHGFGWLGVPAEASLNLLEAAREIKGGAGSARSFFRSLRSMPDVSLHVKPDVGDTRIFVSAFDALKDAGYRFSRQRVIAEILEDYPGSEYPAVCHTARRTYIRLKGVDLLNQQPQI